MSCNGNDRNGIISGAKSLHLSVATGLSIQNPSASIDTSCWGGIPRASQLALASRCDFYNEWMDSTYVFNMYVLGKGALIIFLYSPGRSKKLRSCSLISAYATLSPQLPSMERAYSKYISTMRRLTAS